MIEPWAGWTLNPISLISPQHNLADEILRVQYPHVAPDQGLSWMRYFNPTVQDSFWAHFGGYHGYSAVFCIYEFDEINFGFVILMNAHRTKVITSTCGTPSTTNRATYRPEETPRPPSLSPFQTATCGPLSIDPSTRVRTNRPRKSKILNETVNHKTKAHASY